MRQGNAFRHLIRRLIYRLGIADSVHAGYVRWTHAVDFRAKSRNAHLRKTGAPDGLPVPPPELIYRVTGQLGIDYFLENGRLGLDCIDRVLARHGIAFERMGAVLDFGCGCGRILRHLKTLRGPKLYGVDWNPDAVRWSKASLPFAEFCVNTTSSGLRFFPGDAFDLIFAVSVFTHLPEVLQRFWMRELVRVMRPDGLLLLTVQGSDRLHQLTPAERRRFEMGRCVVIGEDYPGENVCSVFHPEAYVRTVLAAELAVVEYVPGGARDARQDIVLLRKIPGAG
jgi:SAM-dependent methyltransferase